MSIRRVYRLIAAPGRSYDLLKALRALAEQLSPLEGNQGIEVLADLNNPDAYSFIEHWATPETQKAAGALLGKNAFADIGATLGSPPDSTSLVLVDNWGPGRN